MSQRPQPVSNLQEAVTDGRLANVFFRREQLYRLHETVLQNKETIVEAIVKDSGNTVPEAFAEFYATLSAIKSYHDQLKPEAELDAEYRIAKGQDAPGAREGVGIALVRPQEHTFVYSVLAPVSSAIAAGNCVAVVIERDLRNSPPVVAKLLGESLTPDIFEVVSSNVQCGEPNCVQVVQTQTVAAHQPNVLLSPSNALAVAVVDRTANIEEAAKALTSARMTFSGKSPYAPDLILVNEFVKKEFLQAVIRHSIQYMAAQNGTATEAQKRSGGTARTEMKGFRTITSGANGSILDAEDRAALGTLAKVKQRIINTHAVSSLDDAIEVANDAGNGKALAAYAFGNPETCKYLLQFINADAGFANSIPTELLIGPAAPRGHPLVLPERYPTSLFSVPHPRFSRASGLSADLEQILETMQAGRLYDEQVLKKLDLEMRSPAKRFVLAKYFETAALVGALTIVTPAVLGLGVLIVSKGRILVESFR